MVSALDSGLSDPGSRPGECLSDIRHYLKLCML